MIDTMNITDPMELALVGLINSEWEDDTNGIARNWVANGVSYCLVVWIGDRRVECAEIDAETGEVLQLYGDRNRPSEWHDRIAVAVRQYGVERRMAR